MEDNWLDWRGESEGHDLLQDICTEKRGINLDTLRSVLVVAIELAREGREGKKVGTLFVVSEAEETMKQSKTLILDPLIHHPREDKHIDDPNMRETIKELAQLDGAFIVDDDGYVLSGCRYINASSENIELPFGLGSRHMAGASISSTTNAVAVVVSESSIVRVFDDGDLISEILPELWLLQRYRLHLRGPYSTRSDNEMTVASRND